MKFFSIAAAALCVALSAQAQKAPVATTIFQNYWLESVPKAQGAYRVQRLETPGSMRLDSTFILSSNRLWSVSRTTWQPNGDTLETITRWRANGKLLSARNIRGNKQDGVQQFYDANGQLKSRTLFERGKKQRTECFGETGAARPCGEAEYVERMPVYPGGSQAMLSYIGQSVRYPASALKRRKQGKVYVGFIVTETGEIRDVRVHEKVWPDLDAEALRVITAMPRWEPGVQDGELVPVRFTVPIDFKMR